MASTLGVHNPLRYRGYIYDEETGLYYLRSRYYSTEFGRFLSADTFVSTGQGILGNNMFAYCLNNPVNSEDSSGSAATRAFGSITDPLTNPWKDPTTGGGLGSGIGTIGSIALIDAIKDKLKKETFVASKVDTTNSQPQYYGADMRGGIWKIVTPAMDYDDALQWVALTAISNLYGKKASWGLYTSTQRDAQEIAVALGGPIPVLHELRSGEYPHFHVMGMIFFGQYKHFHIWYGAIYGGE